jgi:predicted unusual protein kinase regulating ubiquinone biosynthesis (AarF/ABC1/UbiB family)
MNTSTIFVAVRLARPNACDACARALRRGESAHVVLGASARSVRCPSCFASGCEPVADAASPIAAAPLAAIAASPVVHGSHVVVLSTAAAAGVAAIFFSRTVRRVLVTAAVAIKGAFKWIAGALRGKRGHAPVVVREAFEELGPTYVKLAQLVASSQGLFPDAYSGEFQKCLDRVKPFPYEHVQRTLREELAREPEEIFASLEKAPLASASIAQVHAATLKSGEQVVVKVQRPGIAKILEADLRILRGAARVMLLAPRGDLANPVAIVEDFEANLREELDFANEADNMEEFNRIMAEHHQSEVTAPRVVRELSTKRVLVMERFFGHRVDDVRAIRERAIDGEEKLITGMRAWFQSMIHHGFFHGDVHAGNLMALADGRIGFLDFGIVGRFSKERRAQVTEYLLAFAAGDFARVARVMVAMGAADARVNLDALAKDLAEAYEPLLASSLEGVNYADLLPAVMRVSIKHSMRMPRDFVLITKQMLYFDRYAKLLAPKLNVFRDSRLVTGLAMDVMMAGLV